MPIALVSTRGPGAVSTDGRPVLVDIDATIVVAHSDKDQAAPTWKKTYGFQCAYDDGRQVPKNQTN